MAVRMTAILIGSLLGALTLLSHFYLGLGVFGAGFAGQSAPYVAGALKLLATYVAVGVVLYLLLSRKRHAGVVMFWLLTVTIVPTVVALAAPVSEPFTLGLYGDVIVNLSLIAIAAAHMRHRTKPEFETDPSQ